jgi:diguanylate cyclase
MTEVLVVEQTQAVADVYRDLIESKGLSVRVASSAEDGIDLIARRRPSAVLMELVLPRMNGIEFLRHIRQREDTSNIPVIVSTSSLSSKLLEQARHEGATKVLERANYTPKATVDALMEAMGLDPNQIPESSQKRRLTRRIADPIIESEPEAFHTSLLEELVDLLSKVPIESEKIGTAEFRRELAEYRDKLRLSLNGMDASALITSLVTMCENYFHSARVFLKEKDDQFAEIVLLLKEAAREMANAAGALDQQIDGTTARFSRLAEVDDIQELKRRVAEEVNVLKELLARKHEQEKLTFGKLAEQIEGLQSKLQHAEHELGIDPLTQVANRGAFDRVIVDWIDRHRSDGTSFVLAVIDLDDFKKINDTYGHPIGDRALRTTADWLSNAVRTSDFVARYGGEEFIVLLDHINLDRAGPRLTLLLKQLAVSRYKFETDGESCSLRISASCGVAQYKDGDSVTSLISRADAAMYKAKREGKNRVVLERVEAAQWA